MKISRSILKHLSLALIISMIAFSCNKDPEITNQEYALPETFKVDIPSSISNPNLTTGGRTNGRTEEELSGDAIYKHLGLFIAVGEGASEIIQAIMIGIKHHNVENIKELTYLSDDDARNKNLVVVESAEFEGETWEYQLTITDVESEGNLDGGKALQVFWNNSPVKGIAILKPFNIDKQNNEAIESAVYRVDYSEGGELGYDSHMEVSISGLPLLLPEVDSYSMKALRMFAGKKGDIVDVYGNSNHPNAKFLSGDTGFNWAFVASGDDATNIGVAEVGLPSSNLDSSDRVTLLEDNSIRNVFTNEIKFMFPLIDQTALDAYLVDTNPPGFFNADGFLNAGTSPGEAWTPLADRLSDLTPYNPKETSTLEVMFK